MQIREWEGGRKRGGMRERWLMAKLSMADCGKTVREKIEENMLEVCVNLQDLL